MKLNLIDLLPPEITDYFAANPWAQHAVLVMLCLSALIMVCGLIYKPRPLNTIQGGIQPHWPYNFDKDIQPLVFMVEYRTQMSIRFSLRPSLARKAAGARDGMPIQPFNEEELDKLVNDTVQAIVDSLGDPYWNDVLFRYYKNEKEVILLVTELVWTMIFDKAQQIINRTLSGDKFMAAIANSDIPTEDKSSDAAAHGE